MKGRNGCYGMGGKFRDIGGIKAPRNGESMKVIDIAKGETTGSKPMDGPDGGAARKRMDRPGRRHGGRAHSKMR